MAAEVTTLASTSSNGSLAAVGNSLANVGSVGKAFVLAHPTTMAVAGGVVLGLGTYYVLGKMFRKKETTSTEATPAPVEATPTPA